jgi:maltooligosyltrehalose trehalohydrolase
MGPGWVWAPSADAVAVRIDGEDRPLEQSDDRGGWRYTGPPLAPGTEYAFLLSRGDETRGPFPDPRSPYQPDGVHGPSRTFDHGAYQWEDAGWQPPPLGVIYELHVGTFTAEGTLLAAIDRLDHLVDLGITHVELMPLHAFSGPRGWGYDGAALFAPHAPYCRGPDGADRGPDAVKAFVDACHARGLAVLLDVVYNHLGPSGNYLGAYGPYFTDRYGTPWGDAVNLDGPDSDPVRRFFIDNALMWLRDYHFDGLRLDAVHAFRDFGAVPFLRQLRDEVRQLERRVGRSLALVAESDLGDPRMVQPIEIGGLGMDAQWADELHHALHAVLTGESIGYYADFGRVAHLAKALRNPFVYDGQYSLHRRRRHGAPPTGLGGRRFCVFAQNHDQIGNRARGDRLTELVGREASQVAMALVITSPYVPLLFMGEEWGATTPFRYFTSHAEPELAEAVRQGRRREFATFGWAPEEVPDPQDVETFRASVLDWAERERPEAMEFLRFTRRLLALRASEPDLAGDDRDGVVVWASESPPTLGMRRGRIRVVANLGSTSAEVRVEAPSERPDPGGRDATVEETRPYELLLASFDGAEVRELAVELPPYGVALLRAPVMAAASGSDSAHA